MSTYKNLNLDLVFQAAEAFGFRPTGHYFQLNSYENRVFDLFVEEDAELAPRGRVIVKVYRPERWSHQALCEEHNFLDELQAEGLTAVAPLRQEGESCFLHNGLFFSFFPRAQGRMCQEFSSQDYIAIGSKLATLHNVGAKKRANHRPAFDIEVMGWQALDQLYDWVAPEVWGRYEEAASHILQALEDMSQGFPLQRIHGDCHKGNILRTDPKLGEPEFFFVDFDDFINGLVVQDFWMLLSGDENSDTGELNDLLQGYQSLRHFDEAQLSLIPMLRGLRIITYADWISRRWTKDPTFEKLFPEFRNYTYWVDDTEALEKLAWSI